MHSYLLDSLARTGRAKLAVQKIGRSVFLHVGGVLKTFLGVSVLAFQPWRSSSSYVPLLVHGDTRRRSWFDVSTCVLAELCWSS
jgi:hypothetical protein